MRYENTTDYVETFGSLNEFMNELNNRKSNKETVAKYGEKEPASSRKEEEEGGGTGWYGTEDWGTSIELMNKGYTVGAEQLKDCFEKEEKRMTSVITSRLTTSVMGSAPCIPNYLSGHPRTMYANKRIKRDVPKRCVRIFLDNSSSFDVSGNTLLKSGAVMLNVVNYLERHGYRTEIWAVPFSSRKRKSKRMNYRTFMACVKVKDYRDGFNFQTLAYPLAHVSMFRRQGFRFLETCSADKKMKESGIMDGYGWIVPEENQIEILKNTKIYEDGDVLLTFKMVSNCYFDTKTVLESLGFIK